ncbi:30S ribosomal protein S14 [Candidatus Peregrinibacteria bacterium]|nr:MAG: 30S ribosomal protein S14 [Candidatus Peregrinibacteria bacterium]
MARKALIVKAAKRQKALQNALAAGRKPKFPTRVYNRCLISGRPRGYLRYFGMSRIEVRKLASEGKLPGVTKSSW